MATFNDYGVARGWWFYFELRCASGDDEFKKEFIEEVLKLINDHEGSFILNGKNDKIKKGISMRGVRG